MTNRSLNADPEKCGLCQGPLDRSSGNWLRIFAWGDGPQRGGALDVCDKCGAMCV
jgi:hypothetical protein